MNPIIIKMSGNRSLRLVERNQLSVNDGVRFFIVEELDEDAMGSQIWRRLGCLGHGRYPPNNKDCKGENIHDWVFYIAKYLFDIERDRAGGPAKEEK